MKYPPISEGQILNLVKKSYSCWLRLIADCDFGSNKKNRNTFSLTLITGMRWAVKFSLATHPCSIKLANLRRIESMKSLLLISLLALASTCRADETLFDNYGSYVNIEHQEGFDNDRILIISKERVYIGQVEQGGYFQAYGINGSVWGEKTGAGQVITLQSFADGIE